MVSVTKSDVPKQFSKNEFSRNKQQGSELELAIIYRTPPTIRISVTGEFQNLFPIMKTTFPVYDTYRPIDFIVLHRKFSQMQKSFLLIVALLFLKSGLALSASVDSAQRKKIPVESFHVQLSVVNQWHGKMNFPYSGPASLDSNPESKLSLTATLFYGRKLWKNAAIYFNPEITGGSGFSKT